MRANMALAEMNVVAVLCTESDDREVEWYTYLGT